MYVSYLALSLLDFYVIMFILFLQSDDVLDSCSAPALGYLVRSFCLFCTFAFPFAGSPPVSRGDRQGGHPISRATISDQRFIILKHRVAFMFIRKL